MKIQHTKPCITALIISALALSSCGTRRPREATLPSSSTSPVLHAQEQRLSHIEQVKREQWGAIKATLQGSIQLSSTKSFSSSISMVAEQGKGIRLSLRPLPILEVARVWFTPEGITLVDLYHGRYAQESYQTLSQLIGFTLSYDQVEALWLGQPFVLGQPTPTSSLAQLQLTQDSNGGAVLVGNLKGLQYDFSIDSNDNVSSFAVSNSKQDPVFRTSYKGRQVGDDTTTFPIEVIFSLLKSGKEQGSLQLEWRRVSSSGSLGDILTPKIKSNYERIELSSLLQRLSKD